MADFAWLSIYILEQNTKYVNRSFTCIGRVSIGQIYGKPNIIIAGLLSGDCFGSLQREFPMFCLQNLQCSV